VESIKLYETDNTRTYKFLSIQHRLY